MRIATKGTIPTIRRNAVGRRKPRVPVRLAATVRGVDGDGARFEVPGSVVELGVGGVYLQLPRAVEVSSRLFVAIRFGGERPRGEPAPHLALRGTARRVERKDDGTTGVAVAVSRYRFV